VTADRIPTFPTRVERGALRGSGRPHLSVRVPTSFTAADGRKVSKHFGQWLLTGARSLDKITEAEARRLYTEKAR